MSNLRSIGLIFVSAAFLSGGLSAWLWMQSTASWRAHQSASYLAGVTLYGALQNGTAPPAGVTLRTLPPEDQTLAATGQFRQIRGASPASRLTIIPISPDVTANGVGLPLTLAVLSPDLTYNIADLPNRDGQTAAETLGAVTTKFASFCSDPVVVAKMGDAPWIGIEGSTVWGCEASPSDLRLLAVFLAVVSMSAMITLALNQSADFMSFAQQLRDRRRVGGPTQYDATGPQELREIVSAVNGYLELERDQLASRAAVLSGVSHDLGTPATRLRLRAALIPDADLRKKFENDIDTMTGIIESVLSYTNVEMNSEAPRPLSLTSLVDAIVADYQDIGRPVKSEDSKELIVQGARSIFMSRQGQGVVPSEQDVIVVARPVALQRAITNLIENALKYGRRAHVSIETTADTATVVIEDEGTQSSAQDIEALMDPFQRGDDTATIDGHGLGLTIVATIAKLHGGSLVFEDVSRGVAAKLEIQRS
ncbi:sensor histidine kinase [Pseudooctadecabacter jejudonensis]|uniref:histidine kinase n=1 Tax=Pseudooctadecabacter jejudonensis TaxID=1391910 RepID=A0A1Y5R6U4_9RHOB|nr:HAMP domain-containing sensor histidine kinase [Pseudooctadecabacter jejudonensis]SLN10538.1 Osmolarity sensor protein EnvZ [Pseudooctadecabacter jejudonensis]